MSHRIDESKGLVSQQILLVSFVSIILATVGCETTYKRNERIANAWKKPSPTLFRGDGKTEVKKARTYIYWNDLSNLIDSIYETPLSADGRLKPHTLADVGGIVCGRVARELNELPTKDVDEDAIRAGQKTYAVLAQAAAFYTEFGGLNEAAKDDPGAFSQNDPGRSIGAGMSAAEKERSREQEAEIELAKARALLEGRYHDFEFKMPYLSYR